MSWTRRPCGKRIDKRPFARLRKIDDFGAFYRVERRGAIDDIKKPQRQKGEKALGRAVRPIRLRGAEE